MTFKTIYGPIGVASTHLRNMETGESARLMREGFGVEGERYSDARNFGAK